MLAIGKSSAFVAREAPIAVAIRDSQIRAFVVQLDLVGYGSAAACGGRARP